MVGYKIVDYKYSENLCNTIIEFKIGKTYHREKISNKLPSLIQFNDEGSKKEHDPIKINNHAVFYFYKDIVSLFKQHEVYMGMKVLEIEAENWEDVYTLAAASTDITIVREVPREEIVNIIELLEWSKSDNPRLREVSAIYGCNLEKLIDDEDELVRAAVAEHGYGSDLLSRDESEYVRSGVALAGKELNRLVDDKAVIVRLMVANRGYAVDRLKIDNNENVRSAANSYITYFM